MSADNYIYIDPKTFEVWICMASKAWTGKKKWTPEAQKMSKIGKAKSLKEAIEMAEKYEKKLIKNGSYLEYGISFRLWHK